MKVKSIENKKNFQRVQVDEWIFDLPLTVSVRKGKNIKIECFEDEKINPKDYDIVLDGFIFRSFESYSLASFGGLIAKMPVQKTLDTRVQLCISSLF